MTFSQVVLIAIAIGIVIWIRLKKSRLQPKKNYQMKQMMAGDSTAQKIYSLIQKETPLSCLLNDEKIFGEGFKNKTVPALPCSIGCQCSTVNFIVDNSAFSDNIDFESHYRESDLGQLSFLEFKYYKYSLIIKQARKALGLGKQDLKNGELEENKTNDAASEYQKEMNEQYSGYSAGMLGVSDVLEYEYMKDSLTVKNEFKELVDHHLYGDQPRFDDN